MRYVVMSLALLLLAVAVGGQDRASEPKDTDRFSRLDRADDDGFDSVGGDGRRLTPVPDDGFSTPAGEGSGSATHTTPPADFPDPFGDAPGTVPAADPANLPLTEGQAVALRQGITRTREAAALLGQAAEAFKKGGNAEAAGRAFEAAQTAREVSTAVAGGLERRETSIAEGIQKLEGEAARIRAEIDRLKEELRRTQEGKPQPASDVFGQPADGAGSGPDDFPPGA